MADTPPKDFGSAWLAAFTNSKLGAAVSAVSALGVAFWGYYEWSQLPERTPREVFLRISTQATVLLAIVVWHAWSAWNKEHEGRITADGLRAISESIATAKKKNQSIAIALTEVYDKGHTISNWVLSDDEDYQHFKNASNLWLRELREKLVELKCQEYEINEVCFPPYSALQKAPPFEEYQKPTWNERKRTMYFRLEKLHALIVKYAETLSGETH